MMSVNDERVTDKDRIINEIDIVWKKIGEIENNETSYFRLSMRSNDLYGIDKKISLDRMKEYLEKLKK